MDNVSPSYGPDDDPDEQLLGMDECDICDHEQPLGAPYGGWTCSNCGQEYVYDEAERIELTEAQWELLRAAYREVKT